MLLGSVDCFAEPLAYDNYGKHFDFSHVYRQSGEIIYHDACLVRQIIAHQEKPCAGGKVTSIPIKSIARSCEGYRTRPRFYIYTSDEQYLSSDREEKYRDAHVQFLMEQTIKIRRDLCDPPKDSTICERTRTYLNLLGNLKKEIREKRDASRFNEDINRARDYLKKCTRGDPGQPAASEEAALS